MPGRLRRLAPPAALFLGLFLFGVSLLVLGTEATEEGTRDLDPASLTTVNGTALLVYPVEFFGQRTERIDVTYAFPQGPGDARFVHCEDLARLRRGEAAEAPLLAFHGLNEGSFVVSRQTVTDRTAFFTTERVPDGPEGEREIRRYCAPAVVFTWDASGGDPTPNRPTVVAEYHSASLDGESFAALAILMGASALLALLGGLAWARVRLPATRPLSMEDSTVEALRASLERMGGELERTRRHLLLAGVLGVFLWYPFLVPWAWQQAARSTDDPVIPWGVAALTLAFLLVLTVLWAREFLRLDRELDAWRGRLGELQHREEHLMDALEHGG